MPARGATALRCATAADATLRLRDQTRPAVARAGEERVMDEDSTRRFSAPRLEALVRAVCRRGGSHESEAERVAH